MESKWPKPTIMCVMCLFYDIFAQPRTNPVTPTKKKKNNNNNKILNRIILCRVIIFLYFHCLSTGEHPAAMQHGNRSAVSGQMTVHVLALFSLVIMLSNPVLFGHWGKQTEDGGDAMAAPPSRPDLSFDPQASTYPRPRRPPGTVRREIIFFFVSPGTSRKTTGRTDADGVSLLLYILYYIHNIYYYIITL